MKVFNKIEKSMVEGMLLSRCYKLIGNFFKKIIPALLRKIDYWLQGIALRRYSQKIPVENNKIAFLMFSGDYTCNGRGICEEIIHQKLPYQLVWGIYKKQLYSDQYPPEVKTSIRKSLELYNELSSAKIIIDNGISMVSLGYQKKPEQILIETWHGSLGIKKFSPDTNKDKEWVKKAFKEAAMTDYIISNSTFEDDIYRSDYWKTTKIWRFGHARNDILFKKEKWIAIREKVYKTYHIPEECRICLYAPTFRDDHDFFHYCIDYTLLQKTLEERFGGEWRILTRFHYRVLKKLKSIRLSDNTIDASDFPDIQELMTCVDVGITDYSSWICEFFLTRRPSFIFATDKDTYANTDRELFFPLEELPSPVASDMDALLKNIKEFDENAYICRCNSFLEEKGSVDDGHAAERTVEKIKELMKDDE